MMKLNLQLTTSELADEVESTVEATSELTDDVESTVERLLLEAQR